ncbi:MAG: hypothetical protein IKY21_06335 [Clostridia bacterium]|nr:hypothetical protein [Clostridia bacterium]
MRSVIQTQKYGEIVYDESYWTGKKTVTVGGVQLKKVNKKTFVGEINGEQVTALIAGSFLSGAIIDVNGDKFRMTEPAKWYDYVLSFAWVAIYLVWSVSEALCMIFPVVGGALGGVVAGLGAAAALFIIKPMKNIAAKIAVSLGMFVAVMLVNFALALIYISAVL